MAVWLLTELMEDGDTLFGLCDLGLGCPELGYVSWAELQALRGALGLGIRRDECFAPRRYPSTTTRHPTDAAGST